MKTLDEFVREYFRDDLPGYKYSIIDQVDYIELRFDIVRTGSVYINREKLMADKAGRLQQLVYEVRGLLGALKDSCPK